MVEKDKVVKVIVIGRRLLVEKKKIDLGAMRSTPTMEEEGMKNSGTIIGVGQIGLRAWFMGIRKGRRITFRKCFSANDETQDTKVFVNLEDVLCLEE